MTIEQKFLLDIIKATINNQSITIPLNCDKTALFNLAKRHSLLVMVYIAFMRSGLGKEIPETLKKEVYKLILKATSLDRDSQNIIELFKENGLKLVPFKGYNIKKYYPSPDMRYSLDFDCVIDEKQVRLVKSLLSENGYRYIKTTDMHLQYFSKNENLLELHTKLFSRFLTQEYKNEIIKEYYDNNMQLSIETEYVISLAHLASHFISGGVGIRNVIDLYLLGKGVDRQKLNESLEKFNLKKFDEKFTSLASVIFLDKEPTNFENNLLKFIFKSFYLGSEQQKELYIVALNFDGDIKKAKRKGFFKKIYPSYKYMCGIYPILKKHKILLPWYHFVRHITVIFKRSFHLNKLKQIFDYKESEVKELKEVLVGLGLDHIKE